jgi:hypothetical protein
MRHRLRSPARPHRAAAALVALLLLSAALGAPALAGEEAPYVAAELERGQDTFFTRTRLPRAGSEM